MINLGRRWTVSFTIVSLMMELRLEAIALVPKGSLFKAKEIF